MVVLLVGCTRVILGTVHPVAPGAEPAPIRMADLLIEPGQFPARYPAVVLDATAVYRALQDVDGVAAASVVNPPQCAPPPRAPQDTAAVQGIDSHDASSLIVTVTRPATPLRARGEQLTACPSFTAVRGKDTSVVTVTVLPAPPVDADDGYAVFAAFWEYRLTRKVNDRPAFTPRLLRAEAAKSMWGRLPTSPKSAG